LPFHSSSHGSTGTIEFLHCIHDILHIGQFHPVAFTAHCRLVESELPLLRSFNRPTLALNIADGPT
jgi:hypothetical protein